MRNWIACSSFSILFLSLSILFTAFPLKSQSQSLRLQYSGKLDVTSQDINYTPGFRSIDTMQTDLNPDLPDPKNVLFKSMMVPGWGQIVNKQAWKVPIVYGLLGGLGYYSVYLTKKYHDYRAAYYNLHPDLPDDFRFGETPPYIPENANLRQVKLLRNQFKNNRDLVYVGIVLAYGLNIVDAYVFAHMRSFDVSEDLSMRARIQPDLLAQSTPGVTLSIDLISK